MEEQVSEAKEMLSSKDSQQKEEAVKILIAISRQGRNKEATDLLAKCLEESQGITPETEDDVKWCVKIAEEEKRLRYAIERLYNSLKKDGEDKVAIQDIDGRGYEKSKGKTEGWLQLNGITRNEPIAISEMSSQIMPVHRHLTMARAL